MSRPRNHVLLVTVPDSKLPQAYTASEVRRMADAAAEIIQAAWQRGWGSATTKEVFASLMAKGPTFELPCEPQNANGGEA